MNNRILPIFPLPLVQFPNAITPLHIFEARYRKMLQDVMEADKTFGIMYRNDQLSFDSEQLPVGSVGCSVEVAVVQDLPDGRSNILCVGINRFRLLRYEDGELYAQAEVEIFEDEETFEDLSTEAARAKELFLRVLRASRKLRNNPEEESDQIPDLPDEPQSLSFIVSAYLDIENSEKQDLLELTDTGQRLREVNGILARLADDYERKAILAQLAKKNGHGGKLPNLN